MVVGPKVGCQAALTLQRRPFAVNSVVTEQENSRPDEIPRPPARALYSDTAPKRTLGHLAKNVPTPVAAKTTRAAGSQPWSVRGPAPPLVRDLTVDAGPRVRLAWLPVIVPKSRRFQFDDGASGRDKRALRPIPRQCVIGPMSARRASGRFGW